MILALTILDAALAIGVIVIIMMQSGKASGLGALGGGGGSQALFGQKKSKDEMLAKLTTYLAGSWMAVTLLLTILSRRMG